MINERDINELRPGDRITIDVWFGGMGVDEYGDSCYLFSGTPGYAPCAHIRNDRFKSCNPRFTDQSPDTGKTIDHIPDPQDKVKPPEIEDVRIATLTADRDAALARLADIVTTLEARYDWSKMPLDDPLGLLLRQFDTDGVWIGEVE